MRDIRIRCQHTDWGLWLCCTACGIYGLILVYSAVTSGAGGNTSVQLFCLCIGIVVAFVISLCDYHTVCRSWKKITVPTALLMILTFTPLGYQVPGTDDRNWLSIPLGNRQFLLQPSECLKIVCIVTFALHLATCHLKMYKPMTWVLLGLHATVPTAAVLLQGDDGNAFVLFAVFVLMAVFGGIPRHVLLTATISITAAIPLLWRYLDDEKRARFLCLFEVEKYQQGIGWQQELSVTAVGSGGVNGVGFLQGGDHHLYARQNDFIFTVAGEEFGFIGATTVLLLLAAVLLCLYRNARMAADPLGRLLCGGMFALIAVQSLVNLGMNLRLAPVLGITLPFFSAGGSSLLTVFSGIGIAMSVYRFQDRSTLGVIPCFAGMHIST